MRAASPNKGFFWLDNELVDLFQPLIGTHASAVYNALVRQYHAGEPLKLTTRALAKAAKCSGAMVSRAVELLQYVGMVGVRRGGGNQPNAYDLFDLKALARHLGATSNRSGTAYSFPAHVRTQLQNEIAALKSKQAGKHPVSSAESSSHPAAVVVVSEDLLPCTSHGHAGASPEKRQCTTRETQNGSHLLLQNTRLQDSLYPTLTHEPEAERQKTFPNEVGTRDGLYWARVKFTGVMKDMADHLFASRPSLPHLTNGAADWEDFGFGSLSIVRVSWRDDTVFLVVAASDPVATQRGLQKYSRKWEASLRKRYESEVQVELQLT